jgi:cytochrome P450
MALPKNDLDLTSPQFLADPYAAYEVLRRERPVCFDERLGYWLVSRYADVFALLRDHRLSSDQLGELMGRPSAADQQSAAPLREILTGRMLLTDNPDHRRIRMLMQLAFTPRQVERMRPVIQSFIDELLDQGQAAGRMDLVAQFADPMPAHVIAVMLGLPPEDRHRFKTWTDDIYAFMGLSAEPLAERARRASASAAELRTYLADLFARIRRNPQDDLLSAMVAAEEQGSKLTEKELFSNVVGMINAAHETTTNLICNTILALLRNPDQWQQVAAQPDLATSAVEEGLRYDSPIQMLGRHTLEEVEVQGVTIPAGQRVALMLGAADRDGEQFPDPDRFDVNRQEIKHVAFGGGPHFCLGAALGRLEGQMALAAIARRFPKLKLATPRVTWRPYPVFRGLMALPVMLE